MMKLSNPLSSISFISPAVLLILSILSYASPKYPSSIYKAAIRGGKTEVSRPLKDSRGYDRALDPSCFKSNISTLEVPLFPDRPGSKTFPYRYKLVPAIVQPSVGTLIYLPGGPGGTSSHNSAPLDHVDVIYTDPRGAGCNQLSSSDLPDQAIKTESIAADILSVIRHMNLKNYIIHGHSYGTVLGTVLAHQIELTNLNLPKALVLEGTVGKKYSKEEQKEQIIRAFSEFLPYEVRRKFEMEARKKKPYGVDQSKFIHMLQLSSLLERPNLAINFIRQDHEGVSLETRELKALLPKLKDSIEKLQVSRTYQQISKEVMPGTEGGSYDSANYKVSVPIIYFHGTIDAQTPYESAKYHYDQQTESPTKIFFKISGAGHSTLSNCLSHRQPLLWETIFDTDFSDPRSYEMINKILVPEATKEIHCEVKSFR